MPPSHPRPEDLAALGADLSATAGHAAESGEQLLDEMVTIGDHATQRAVDDLVDDAVDALRELAATCREIALTVSAGASPSPGSASTHDAVLPPRARSVR